MEQFVRLSVGGLPLFVGVRAGVESRPYTTVGCAA